MKCDCSFCRPHPKITEVLRHANPSGTGCLVFLAAPCLLWWLA